MAQVLCKLCNVLFPTDHDLHIHKSQSSRHVYCDKCGQDFNNRNAFKQHHDLLHAKEQDMKCPGCGKNFTRAGSLIAHIELGTCGAVRAEDIERARKENERVAAATTAARNFQDFSRSGALGDGPNPFAPLKPVFDGDNLIGGLDSWGPVAEALNEPVTSLIDFPALNGKPPNIMDSPITGPAPGSAWNVKKNLFPAVSNGTPPAPPARPGVDSVLPPPQARMPDPKPNEHDPNSLDFDIRKYWIPLIGKYKCPYLGCSKSNERRNAFIQHLKSPAHRNEKLQCIHCLRYFSTATALTQHMESQGTRCKVREITNYASVVDVVTGGVVATGGRHEDDTVKYVVNEALLTASGVVEANRAAHMAETQKKVGHWDQNMPRW